MNLQTDYRKIHELLSKANKLTGNLIELSDTQKDHFKSLRANVDNDIFITEHHNMQISHIDETIKEKTLELLHQLREIQIELKS